MHDKLYLPGLQKLKRLIDSGFFGRILSVRGEFGYWVFEGDWQPAQRPSWNYRAEDGGGIIVDMFPHWNYVLENLFGEVKTVYAQAAVHIADRWDEKGEHYTATAEDAAYGIFELEGGVIAQINSSWTVRVNRDELVEFHVDGTHGSAVVGLFGAKIQPRNATPKPVWNPDLADDHDYDADWIDVPTNEIFQNGFKQQWEEFLVSFVEGTDYEFDLLSGARGVLLAEAGLQSSREGRKVELPQALAGLTEPMTELTLLDADGRDIPRRTGADARLLQADRRRCGAASPTPPRTSCRWSGATTPRASPADIDWDSTLAFRRPVYSWGLGVADAMDTAQRNMGLDAAATRELIARSAQVAREEGGSVVVGVNTDHVDEELIGIDAVIDAYKEQLHFTEEQGAGPVLMAIAGTSPAPRHRPTTTAACTARCSRRRRRPSCCTGSARRSTRCSRAISARPTGARHPTFCSRSSRRTPTRSPASR